MSTTKGETLYRKVGRRYYPVGPEFSGFPAEGMWLVIKTGSGKHEHLFCKMADLEKLDIPKRAALAKKLDEACEIVHAGLKQGGFTIVTLVNDIFDAICKK